MSLHGRLQLFDAELVRDAGGAEQFASRFSIR